MENSENTIVATPFSIKLLVAIFALYAIINFGRALAGTSEVESIDFERFKMMFVSVIYLISNLFVKKRDKISYIILVALAIVLPLKEVFVGIQKIHTISLGSEFIFLCVNIPIIITGMFLFSEKARVYFNIK